MPRRKKNLRALLLPLHKRRASLGSAENGQNAALQAIWDVVARIPRGTVATYGDVAHAAGLPGRARQAGYALKHLPDDMHLPWHRVVGAGGKIVFPSRSSQHREQTRLLRSEGVEVQNGRVARSAMHNFDTPS